MRKSFFGYKISDVNKKIDSLQEEIESLNASIITHKIHNKNSAIKSTKTLLLEEELRKYENDLYNLSTENNELKTQNINLANEYESLKKQYLELKMKNEDLHKENMILKQQLADSADSEVAITYEENPK